MAKKNKGKSTSNVNIKEAVLKNPVAVIQALTSNIQGLKFTKVIQTFVMETHIVKIQLFREGRPFMQGDLIWLGNNKDKREGTVFCFQADKGNEMRQVTPNNDNAQDIVLDVSKSIIKINAIARLRCAVCGKAIEIFDSELQCPICEAKAHSEHLKEWVKMKNSCPVCKKPLNLNRNGIPIEVEEDEED
ncbi:MAG: hypothetical protein GY870_04570 [archaeon]|nr:hypothetical protein [archaeon]